mmetsp:Transcript_22600/g.44776  ORF Transcript_22600/g.44776 Transcript_22600/m.44776 type:complete len:286 (-) Transcript_22600:2103-2960(-)
MRFDVHDDSQGFRIRCRRPFLLIRILGVHRSSIDVGRTEEKLLGYFGVFGYRIWMPVHQNSFIASLLLTSTQHFQFFPRVRGLALFDKSVNLFMSFAKMIMNVNRSIDPITLVNARAKVLGYCHHDNRYRSSFTSHRNASLAILFDLFDTVEIKFHLFELSMFKLVICEIVVFVVSKVVVAFVLVIISQQPAALLFFLLLFFLLLFILLGSHVCKFSLCIVHHLLRHLLLDLRNSFVFNCFGHRLDQTREPIFPFLLGRNGWRMGDQFRWFSGRLSSRSERGLGR